MSAHTQARKRHNMGRALLSPEEVKIGVPWYLSAWNVNRKALTAKRIEARIERNTVRRLEREDRAKGIFLSSSSAKPSLLSRVFGIAK